MAVWHLCLFREQSKSKSGFLVLLHKTHLAWRCSQMTPTRIPMTAFMWATTTPMTTSPVPSRWCVSEYAGLTAGIAQIPPSYANATSFLVTILISLENLILTAWIWFPMSFAEMHSGLSVSGTGDPHGSGARQVVGWHGMQTQVTHFMVSWKCTWIGCGVALAWTTRWVY